ncbi:MAG TPA: ABC transporter permease [Clostridia bacterium]|nr:ABC transporter permease [Clostridia bacterium]
MTRSNDKIAKLNENRHLKLSGKSPEKRERFLRHGRPHAHAHGAWRKAVKLFIRRNSRLCTGLGMLMVLLFIAATAGVFSPYDPQALSHDMVAPPGAAHPLGTDGLGRDVLSIILHGSRISLLVGFTAAVISAIVGTLLGVTAGYWGGRVDALVGEFINAFMMMPTFFLILIVIALFGSGIGKVMIVIGLTGWTGNAKVMRAQAMSLRNRTFVKAAQAIGESRGRIMFAHIIPNGIMPVIANTAMGVCTAIMTESSLSFLGLGDPNVVSWGQLIYNGKAYITNGWWICVYGGLAIVFTVITFYLIGDGINILLNPKLRNVM